MVDLASHPATWTAAQIGERSDGWQHPFGALDPDEVRGLLENGPGVVLLRGFPLDGHDKDSARDAFLAWCGSVGTAVSQNERGTLVFDVEDAGLPEGDPRNRGPNTKKKLSFHTDRCDVIAFLCWRQARSGGENEIVSSQALYQKVGEERPDLLAELESPFPYKRHTVDLGNEKPWCEQPVFSFREGRFACSFLRVLIDRAHADPDLPNLSSTQVEAMDFLESVAARDEFVYRFRQEPGDVLLLNNWVTLHRRTAFEDHPGPDDRRCLFRIWLSVPDSRPLDPLFAANFGSVEPGAIRGGMKPSTPPASP